MDAIEMVRKLTHLFYMARKDNLMGLEEHPKIKHRDIMAIDAILSIKDGELVKMSDLSSYMRVTPAAVSQIIKNYEHRGWVERVVLDDDRRSVYIKVSDKARSLMKSCKEDMNDTLLAFIEFLGEEDAEAFIRIMEKVIDFSKVQKEKKEGASK